MAFDLCEGLEAGVQKPHPSVICLKGQIDPTMAVKYSDTVDDNVSFAVIEGPGGFLTPAIDMAEDFTIRGLHVVVGDLCVSSCSQFLFVGGAKRTLLESGSLFFHGGPISEDAIAEMDLSDEAKDNLRKENTRFAAFYAARGVSLKLLTDPPPEVQSRLNSGQIVFWKWSREKLEGFGLQME